MSFKMFVVVVAKVGFAGLLKEALVGRAPPKLLGAIFCTCPIVSVIPKEDPTFGMTMTKIFNYRCVFAAQNSMCEMKLRISLMF